MKLASIFCHHTRRDGCRSEGSGSSLCFSDRSHSGGKKIIVTATKRSENMQDVQIAIQALDSTALSERGISSFEDYALVLPNLSF